MLLLIIQNLSSCFLSQEPQDLIISRNHCNSFSLELAFYKYYRNETVQYNIPNSFSKRAPSLGYGDRSSFIPKSKTIIIQYIIIKLDEAPAPTSYNPKSDFDKTAPHGRAFSFGIAREAYAKVYIKENPLSDSSIPGPGAYVVPPKIGNEAQKYSIYGRNANHSNLNTKIYLLY